MKRTLLLGLSCLAHPLASPILQPSLLEARSKPFGGEGITQIGLENEFANFRVTWVTDGQFTAPGDPFPSKYLAETAETTGPYNDRPKFAVTFDMGPPGEPTATVELISGPRDATKAKMKAPLRAMVEFANAVEFAKRDCATFNHINSYTGDAGCPPSFTHVARWADVMEHYDQEMIAARHANWRLVDKRPRVGAPEGALWIFVKGPTANGFSAESSAQTNFGIRLKSFAHEATRQLPGLGGGRGDALAMLPGAEAAVRSFLTGRAVGGTHLNAVAADDEVVGLFTFIRWGLSMKAHCGRAFANSISKQKDCFGLLPKAALQDVVRFISDQTARDAIRTWWRAKRPEWDHGLGILFCGSHTTTSSASCREAVEAELPRIFAQDAAAVARYEGEEIGAHYGKFYLGPDAPPMSGDMPGGQLWIAGGNPLPMFRLKKGVFGDYIGAFVFEARAGPLAHAFRLHRDDRTERWTYDEDATSEQIRTIVSLS